MVVVMSPDASTEDVAAVVTVVEQAGGEAFVSRGVSRTIVGLVGDVTTFAALNLQALRGVGEVVRISTPYKLVSRENHPETSTIEVGGVPIGPTTFTLIAGPCAVETPEQTLAAARMAQDAGAVLLRGGAFKPRTSPYAFQGLGERRAADPRRGARGDRDADRHRGRRRRRRAAGRRATPTCSRSAPATCRTSRCCRRSAPRAGR